MRHFGIYANSGDVQTAISAGTLVNPYVALVDGVLDYNGVAPAGPDTGVGLTIITSDGSVFSGSTEDGIVYDVSFEKPYDSTFTVYYNGEVVTAETGTVDYQRCYWEDGEMGDNGYNVWDEMEFNNTELEDLDYGTQFGEEGDTVTVEMSYEPPRETGCGEDEPYDEPCPNYVWMNITNENCYGCEGAADPCECSGAEDDGEGGCDCGGDPECDCKMNGGYWDGTDCWYRALPCYIGKWSNDGEGHYTFQITNPDDAAFTEGTAVGLLYGVFFNGGQEAIDMDVTFSFDGTYWTVTFHEPNESASPSHTFEAGIPGNWDCENVMTDGNSSTASVHIGYDGDSTFEFYQMAQDAPALSMGTYNPECSEGGSDDDNDPGE